MLLFRIEPNILPDELETTRLQLLKSAKKIGYCFFRDANREIFDEEDLAAIKEAEEEDQVCFAERCSSSFVKVIDQAAPQITSKTTFYNDQPHYNINKKYKQKFEKFQNLRNFRKISESCKIIQICQKVW